MLHSQGDRFWRVAVQCLAGSILVALLTFVCFRHGLNLATTVCVYLIVIVLMSLQGSFLSSAIVSLIAIGCLAYYFAPPIFSFRVNDQFDGFVIAAFLTTSAVITHLVSSMRRAEISLRERANLLNLTRDTIFVRGMDDVIAYWNRGAEELYGWPAEKAIGKVSHQLMQTVFPAPIDEIGSELARNDRWEGELVHTRADGSEVIVASRWALQRDERQRPVAILETNNDITERRRAEVELSRSERDTATSSGQREYRSGRKTIRKSNSRLMI